MPFYGKSVSLCFYDTLKSIVELKVRVFSVKDVNYLGFGFCNSLNSRLVDMYHPI